MVGRAADDLGPRPSRHFRRGRAESPRGHHRGPVQSQHAWPSTDSISMSARAKIRGPVWADGLGPHRTPRITRGPECPCSKARSRSTAIRSTGESVAERINMGTRPRARRSTSATASFRPMSVGENSSLASLLKYVRGLWIGSRAERDAVQQQIADVRVKTSSADALHHVPFRWEPAEGRGRPRSS